MQASDYDDFVMMLTAVGDLYGRAPSEMAITIWWGALQHYDLAAIRQGFDRHVRNPDTGQFMPKPADIVKMLQGSTQDSAMVAWSNVDRAVRQVGTYSSVVFDDALIHRVIHDMGGWVALGIKTEDEWPFVAREFENRYRGYRSRNERPDYPSQLIGIAESQNAQNGLKSQPPVLIGDPEKAKTVLLNGSRSPLIGFERMAAAEMLSLSCAQKEVA